MEDCSEARNSRFRRTSGVYELCRQLKVFTQSFEGNEKLEKTKHIPALDGLRGLAALIVFISHFSGLTKIWGNTLGQGYAHVGVMIFFILSGFLMGYLYFKKELNIETIITFFRRRIARVVPLFLFLVLLSFAVSQLTSDWRLRPYQIKTLQQVFENILLINGESVMWSIVVELRFYFLVPLFWMAALRGNLAFFLMLALGYVGCFFWAMQVAGPETSITVFAFTGPYFLLGIALSAFSRREENNAKKRGVYNVLFLLSLGLIVLLMPSLGLIVLPAADNEIAELRRFVQDYWRHPGSLAICSLLVFSAMRAPLADILLGNRVMRFFGNISYSFYLWHMPILWYYNRFTALGETPYLFFLIAFPTIILVSWISFICIERSTRNWLTKKKNS